MHPPEDTNEVVTIYFAGTGLTEEWWDPEKAVGAGGRGFWTRESVATLISGKRHLKPTRKYSSMNRYTLWGLGFSGFF